MVSIEQYIKLPKKLNLMKKLNRSRHLFSHYFALAAIFLLFACDDWNNVPDFDVEETTGYRPVYATEAEAEVKTLPAQEVENAGKIYVIGDYLLIVEQLRGVHLFDNSDPSNPDNIGFLQIAGNGDVAVRDNLLYADQGANLLAIDISDLNNIKVASTIKDVFPFGSKYPPSEGSYFECPDPSKGLVVGWELTTLQNPKCYR